MFYILQNKIHHSYNYINQAKQAYHLINLAFILNPILFK